MAFYVEAMAMSDDAQDAEVEIAEEKAGITILPGTRYVNHDIHHVWSIIFGFTSPRPYVGRHTPNYSNFVGSC